MMRVHPRAIVVLALSAASCRTPDAPRNRVAVPCAAAPVPSAVRDAAIAEPEDACNRKETLRAFREQQVQPPWLSEEDARAWRVLWVSTEDKRLPSPEEAKAQVAEDVEKIVAMLRSASYTDLATRLSARGLCLMPAKGAACRWMPREELARCGSGGRREEWAVDNGQGRGPRLTCGEAFRDVFRVDFTRATRRYDCFPEVGRGNNSASVINAELRTDVYVEIYAPEHEGMNDWRALWLYLRLEDSGWKLEGLMSEYWGI
jgi:hypothetical protein